MNHTTETRPNIMSLLIYFLSTFVLCNTTFGQEELPVQLSQLRVSIPEDYDKQIAGILSKKPTTEELASALGGVKFRSTDEAKAKRSSGWSQHEVADSNGTKRPYQIYLPEAIEKNESKPVALIVHLHGAVSRPDFGTGLGTPMAVGYANMLWSEVADKENFVVVCPLGRTECAWWTDNGIAHVDAVIRDVRRMVDVPEQSIFGAGFSDGASGCYYRAMVKPDPFAGFISMNGHPMVASRASGKQIYLPNMAATSTIAAMTQEDSLYPSKTVMPHIAKALEFGADVLTISYPKINHQPLYFQDQTQTIVNFIKQTKRQNPERLSWYAADPDLGKVGWLELLEITDKEDAEETEDVANVMSSPARIRMGIQLSQANPNLIEQVIEGSAAAGAGMQSGDLLLEFDGEKVVGSRALRGLLASKKHGEKFSCKIERGEQQVELEGRFPPFVSEPLYSRKLPTGFADCVIQTGDSPQVNITSQNVNRLRVWLPGELASRSEIPVVVNGKRRTVTVDQLTPKEFLQRFAESRDAQRSARYAFIDLNIAEVEN